MRSNYKRLGQYIRQIDVRNKDDNRTNLLGVSVSKVFIDSIANTVGTDFTKYKIVKKNQFTYIPDTSRRGDKIGIALLEDRNEALVSQAYTVFEVIDIEQLLPQYLMMWFKRTEFDRYARFISHGSVREIFTWDDMCNVELPVPSIEKQREIFKEYKVLHDRISLNNTIIEKLEDTAKTIYKQWFVDFEFPGDDGNPYKSNGGEMNLNDELEKEVPAGWKIKKLNEICSISYGKNLRTENLMNEGYYVFGGNGIIGKYKDYMYEREQVLIACRGAASGKINISYPRSYVTNNSIVFENNKDDEFYFLKYYCLNNSFESYVTGSAQPQITIENINGIRLLFPTEKVLNKFSKVIRSIDELHFNKEIENIKILDLANLLLNRLVKVEDNL